MYNVTRPKDELIFIINSEKILNHFTCEQTFTRVHCSINIKKGNSPRTEYTEILDVS